ncbi:CPBP family intramembrane metalloprotease [Clostridium sp. D2Q-11]|uniref:CPBP family intramembrane metalloprotease n=1 Tax=Anaeromonas frigoriresistens TaxID=2683708 RepID=A0A942Z814_9FIRM|nr:type II CAAX endopeptidase family protein [Anaeromonas frigoriresistens]MBS4537489.1 CPBP family intramembrane metalloprotease [Anaeromonas frigoriresistens]
MKSKELLRFFIYTFLISWSIWGIAILKSYSVLEFSPSYKIFIYLGSYGPSIVAIILTAIYGGKDKVRRLLKSGLHRKYNMGSCFYMFLLMPGILFFAYLFTNYAWDLKFELPLFQKPLLLIVVFFYILILGGPLGEEFGWRGFALNRLLDKYTPVTASILLGFIWTIWHIPLFFIEGSVQQDINFVGYMIFTIILSILITNLFIKTNRSVFAVIVFHTTSNLSIGLFPIFTSLKGGVSILFFMLLFLSIIILLNKDRMFKKRKEKLEEN